VDRGDALGVIAAAGALPRLIAEDRRAAGRPYLVCAFEGVAPDWIGEHPHAVAPFEKPGALFAALRRAGVGAVVLVGNIDRPALNPLRFDLTAVRLAPTLLPLLRRGGDDAVLRAVGAVFEREGFRLLSAPEALSGLLAPAGPLTAQAPDAAALADVDRAAALVAMIGAQDIGQGAVVADGQCLGLETLQGTDALLDFVARTRAERRPGPGVLFKGPKPDQDRRLDLPAIGPQTVAGAAAAGLAGVAYAAGGVLLIGREATRAEAERHGLWLYGRLAP